MATAAAASFTSCVTPAMSASLAWRKVDFVGQQPRIEFGEGRRELLVIVRQLRLLGVVELGAAPHEAFVGPGQQAQLRGVEAEALRRS